MLIESMKNFERKMELRNQKINAKLAKLRDQEAGLKGKIEDLMKKLIEAEMEEKDTRPIENKIKGFRFELADVQERIAAFEGSKTDLAFTRDDVEKIRIVAVKDKEERYQLLNQVMKEAEKLRTDIQSLEKQLEEKEKRARDLRDYSEIRELRTFVQYIDSRAAKLDYLKKDEFLKTWLDGEDTEQFFKAPEPYRGVIETIRYFEPEPKKPEPVITQDACINRVYYGTPEEIAEMKKRDKVI